MDWQKIRSLALPLICLLFPSCAVFGYRPQTMGKLDKTPEVLILRGQDYITCLPRGAEQVKLTFFVHLRWMPAQEVLVWSGDTKPENPARLFGTELTVNMNAHSKKEMLSYHQLNLEVAGRTYDMMTLVADCAFAEHQW